MKAFAAASTLALALVSAGAASAQDYRIAYGDLDLATSQGAARFDRRVSRAARGACQTGAPLADAQCTARFRAEALDGLPTAHRQDYARARGDRVST